METSDFGPMLLSDRPQEQRVPARRRRRRRKPAARRAALAIVLGAIALVLLARIVATAARPLVVSIQAARDVRRLQAQLDRQHQRRAHLLQEIAYLSTPAGVEEEARRQGWVRDGETAIQIVRPERGVGR